MKTSQLFLFALFLGIVFQSYSQCDPDTNYKNPGIYPNPLENLDTAEVNIPYSEIMTAVIPKDTLVFGNRIPFDSIGVIKFDGLPYGFTWETNTLSGYWLGNSSGCLKISGMASDTQSGIYPLDIKVRAIISGLVNDQKVPGYYIYIKNNNTNIVSLDDDNQYIVCFNKNSQKIQLLGKSSQIELMNFTIYNLNGQNVFSKKINVSQGINSYDIDVKNLVSGIYFVNLSTIYGQKTYKVFIN